MSRASGQRMKRRYKRHAGLQGLHKKSKTDLLNEFNKVKKLDLSALDEIIEKIAALTRGTQEQPDRDQEYQVAPKNKNTK